MAYLGNTPQQKFSQRYFYTASNNQTVFSGTDNNGASLKYEDGRYLDVYLNGVKLLDTTDYTATSKTSVVLNSGTYANDSVEIYTQGIFTIADMVSASSGGTFDENVSFANNVTISNSLSVGGDYVSPVQSFRNKIINGNFDIWQRGTSTSSAGYLADRWSTLTVGSTFTTSRQAFTLGQTDVPGEPTYFHRTVVTSVAGASNLNLSLQRIESVRTLAGQTATLSFWAKADASKNIAVEFSQSFGSGGSPSSQILGIGVTTFALTASWQKFTVTVSIPSISGKTLGSDNNDTLIVVFWFDAGSDYNSRTNSLGQQSGTFDIAQVQLEAGSVATPFEQRPIGTELALCQRYYQAFAGQIDVAQNGSGTSYATWIFSTTMRATPTITQTGINITGQNAINSTAAQWYSAAAALRISSATASAEL